MVKVTLDVITRRIFALSIPRATPARQARTMNTTHTTATKATMPPHTAYTAGPFNCDKIDMGASRQMTWTTPPGSTLTVILSCT